MKNHKTRFTLLLMIICNCANAQLLDAFTLDTTRTFTLKEALQQNPLKIYKLSLKKQKITELPVEIYRFKNLNSLILKNNQLKNFPIKVTEFDYLQLLDISNNTLTSIPQEIGNMIHLKQLHLNQNQLTKLPLEIKKLKKLTLITLSKNKISTLPYEINELKNTLEKIEMREVLINNKEYKKIKRLLPNTRIKYSKYCECD